MFGFKKTQKTLTEQYGTPWQVTLADGSIRRPMDDEECLTGLIDYLSPTPEAPLVIAREGVSETVTSYYAASRFIFTHLFQD